MTEPNDRLAELREQLEGLDDTPLSSHPEVLEQTHRALVEELERLEDLGEPAGGALSSESGEDSESDEEGSGS